MHSIASRYSNRFARTLTVLTFTLGCIAARAQSGAMDECSGGTRYLIAFPDSSIWKASVIDPGPRLDAFDWGKRWVSESPCTKNAEEKYLATVTARNAGDAPFVVVSLRIENDPDGVFSIEATTITPGLIMQPAEARDIPVSFDPKEEKIYYSPTLAMICLICRAIVDGKDSLFKICAPLEGIGIES